MHLCPGPLPLQGFNVLQNTYISENLYIQRMKRRFWEVSEIYDDLSKRIFGAKKKTKNVLLLFIPTLYQCFRTTPVELGLERKFRIGWVIIWREEKNKMTGTTLFINIFKLFCLHGGLLTYNSIIIGNMNQEAIPNWIKDVNLTAKPTLKHWSKWNPQVNPDEPDQRQSARHQVT